MPLHTRPPRIPLPAAPVVATILALALTLVLAACGGGASAPAPSSSPGTVTLTTFETQPNPTGLSLGFWEEGNREPATLSALGKRCTSRVGFDSWASLEPSPGVYDFSKLDTPYALAHSYGESVYAAVNISFSRLITPGRQTIPAFYANNNGGTDTDIITDPTTRAAAKAFLRAYVQDLMGRVGSLTLTIDYEVVSNYRLGTYDSGWAARAQSWADWYVEAAATARQAAADLGMADQLKLQPIVNSDPLDTANPISQGRAANPWLVQVVDASDALAMDTYHCIPGQVTDAQHTLDIIAFWIDQFSGGKPVVLTENGFKTCVSAGIAPPDPGKYAGTEAQQQAYLADLFPKLLAANQPGGSFHNQLRGFHLWCITDNPAKAADDSDRYFGLIRLDGSAKPALATVQSAVAALEADAFHQPCRIPATGADASAALAAGGVPLLFTGGDHYQFLRYATTALPSGSRFTLTVHTAVTGPLLVRINGTVWLHPDPATAFTLDLTPYAHGGKPLTVDLCCPGAAFPFQQTVTQVGVSAA